MPRHPRKAISSKRPKQTGEAAKQRLNLEATRTARDQAVRQTGYPSTYRACP